MLRLALNKGSSCFLRGIYTRSPKVTGNLYGAWWLLNETFPGVLN